MRTVLTVWKLILLLLMGSCVIEVELGVPDAPLLYWRMQVLACKGDGKEQQRLLQKEQNTALELNYSTLISLILSLFLVSMILASASRSVFSVP